MNASKKDREAVGQNGNLARSSHKHDANLQKNSTLYFQIGLILCLLLTHALLETEFKIPTFAPEPYYPDDFDTVFLINHIPEPVPEEKPKEVVRKQKPRIINPRLRAGDPERPITPTIEMPDMPDFGGKVSIPEPSTKRPLPARKEGYNTVERMPIYPGCEKFTTRIELMECMSGKMAKLVSRRFNTDIAEKLGLHGKQRIMVQFTIDTSGRVTEVIANAIHDPLKTEAVRVEQMLPQMIPGRHENRTVEVVYALPIVFVVH